VSGFFPPQKPYVSAFGGEWCNGSLSVSRFLGQVVDIAKVVLQTPSILIRLFPVTSETFAKLFSLSSVLSRLVRPFSKQWKLAERAESFEVRVGRPLPLSPHDAN